MNGHTFHSYVPFRRLKEDLTFLTERSVRPELRLTAEDLDRLKMKDVERLSRELGGHPLTLHAPYRDLSPGAFDKGIRRATRERLEELLEVADILHAGSVVCHLGFDPREHGHHADEWMGHSLETWQPLARSAQRAGIRIHLENVYEPTPELHVRALKELGAENVAICIDVGHCHAYSKTAAHDWFQALAEHVREVHLHDNDGSGDQHLPFGEGTIDFARLFREDLPTLRSALLTFEIMRLDALPAALEFAQSALTTP